MIFLGITTFFAIGLALLYIVLNLLDFINKKFNKNIEDTPVALTFVIIYVAGVAQLLYNLNVFS